MKVSRRHPNCFRRQLCFSLESLPQIQGNSLSSEFIVLRCWFKFSLLSLVVLLKSNKWAGTTPWERPLWLVALTKIGPSFSDLTKTSIWSKNNNNSNNQNIIIITVTSQEDGWRCNSRPGASLCGACMMSLCLHARRIGDLTVFSHVSVRMVVCLSRVSGSAMNWQMSREWRCLCLMPAGIDSSRPHHPERRRSDYGT